MHIRYVYFNIEPSNNLKWRPSNNSTKTMSDIRCQNFKHPGLARWLHDLLHRLFLRLGNSGKWQGKHQFEDGTCQLIALIAQHPKPFGNDGWNILISRWCWVLTEKFTHFWSQRNASAYTSGRRTKNLYTKFQDIKQKLHLQNMSQLH